ncbi:MAG: hypothetical protein WBS22_14530 [Methylocystis sp.]
MGRFRHAGSAAIMGFALSLASAPCAQAAVVISDNFAGAPEANWPGDGIFESIPQPGDVQGSPSVDLVGASNFPDLVAGLPTGVNAVDLGGTTGSGGRPAGELRSVRYLAPGDYSVQFLLAGNPRGDAPDTTEVCIGGSCQLITPAKDQPYTLYNLTFTNASGPVRFIERGPSGQIGNLLANVVVTAPDPNLSKILLSFAAMSALLITVRYRGLLI